MLSQRKQEVINKITLLSQRAEQLFGIVMPAIDIRFDLRGRSAGIAGHAGHAYYLRFNLDLMQNTGWDHLINNTVPHELAHIVCYVNPGLGRNHNPGWRRVCRMLGGTGERCHSEPITYARGLTYYYTTSTGCVIPLSVRRHRAVQQGVVYRFRNNKGVVDRNSHYTTVMPAVAA